MAGALRLSGHPPPPSLRRKLNEQRPKGKARIISSTPFLLSRSNLIIESPGNFFAAASAATSSSWSVEEEGRLEGEDLSEQIVGEASGPLSVELETVSSEDQFDQINAEADKQGMPFVVVWMAHWCRKCIYLKPKLERLAASYHPSVRFYSVDVNSVPHKFVKRADVTRMPTIQLWKGSTKHAEVIGGHKAWLVVNEVRQMIEDAL